MESVSEQTVSPTPKLPEFNDDTVVETESTEYPEEAIINEISEVETVDHTEPSSEESASKAIHLPLSRIKTIMKLDPQVMPTKESVFLITKATELFIQKLAEHANMVTIANKRKMVSKTDVESAVNNNECYEFFKDSLDL
uniref:Transcription factor CBF/NF-Y/archaeal histone domain-containing protein n=1 Tax=Graphocephala atropunctata TaxID=36148 RepID=A0A1B6LBA2_9HEMI